MHINQREDISGAFNLNDNGGQMSAEKSLGSKFTLNLIYERL